MVCEVLESFCHASRLMVNKDKTRVLSSKNIPRHKCVKFLGISSFHFTNNLGKYLGFLLLSRRIGKEDFNFNYGKDAEKISSVDSETIEQSYANHSSIFYHSIYSDVFNARIYGSQGVIQLMQLLDLLSQMSRGIPLVNWDIDSLLKRLGSLDLRWDHQANIVMRKNF